MMNDECPATAPKKWRLLPSAFFILHFQPNNSGLRAGGRRWHKGGQSMKKLICLGLVCLAWTLPAPAQEPAPASAVKVFQIGAADGDYHEFALAGNFQAYAQTFPHDAEFVVGRSEPGQGLAVDPPRSGGRLGRQPRAHVQDHV